MGSLWAGGSGFWLQQAPGEACSSYMGYLMVMGQGQLGFPKPKKKILP